MGSMMRGSSGRANPEAVCINIARRMVNLPRSILGVVSRVVDQGIDLIRTGGRRNHHHLPPPPPPPPPNYPFQQPQDHVQEEGDFLACFEKQYGSVHPFFYACRFAEALKMAKDEHKFVFMYLHSPDHPFTRSFCKETLCSDLVVQFLDANFISWGEIANRGEGLHMATALRADTFPFCAVVAPASGDSLAVLQQMEGPVSPSELVEILQRVMEEQGLAFGSARAKDEEKRRADQRLREEQDVAYLAALQIDQDKDKLKKLPSKERTQKQVESSSNKVNNTNKQANKGKEASTGSENHPKDNATTQILIRFPNGERREKSFLCSDKIQAIYRYVDSVGLGGVGGNYKLISSFPRKVYGFDEMGMSLKDAGLHPRASLFLELV